MKCKKCRKEIQSVEISGTHGMRTSYCCSEIQVDIDSLRPKVRESVKSHDQFYNQLYWKIMKDSD